MGVEVVRFEMVPRTGLDSMFIIEVQGDMGLLVADKHPDGFASGARHHGIG